ncbi:MAG: tail fiber domain-containing protein [Planctomycetota bacterium]|jgi:hypothetical protein
MSWLITCALVPLLQFQPVGETPTTPAATVQLLDVTGDGLLDELRFATDGTVSVAVNVGSKTFMPVRQRLPRLTVTDVLVGDLDGDDLPDLYLVSPKDNVALRGDGRGVFRDATDSLGLADAGWGKSAERLDVDGDGLDDLLLHNVGGDVLFWAQAPGRYARNGAASGAADPLAALSETDPELLALLLASMLRDQGASPGATTAGGGDTTLATPPSDPAGAKSEDPAPPGGTSALTVGPGAGGFTLGGRHGNGGTATPPIIPPVLEAILDDKYVNDDGNEVDSADVVDGSLTGADVSTSGGDVTFYAATLTADKGVFGINSDASGADATVGGGRFNVASYEAATVAGGYYNEASAGYATVGGGRNNTASANSATVAGGRYNDATGLRATVGGGRANQATGDWATIAGGVFNEATYASASVGGGRYNDAVADYATVGGGRDNTASNNSATVAGGRFNTASGDRATVGGGRGNVASGNWATAGGGIFNTASGYYAAIAGGNANTASGNNSAVPGGRDNAAAASLSFAAGRRAKANHIGAFVWGDSFNADKTSSGVNEFNVYASGGTRIFTNGAATLGAALLPNATAWSVLSDRASKENIEPVDVRAVLDAVAALPITTWNYKANDDAVRHMGPMAQDFHAAFGLGASETMIETIDPDGVALAAIPGLHEAGTDRDAEIAALRAELEALKARLGELLDS